MQSNIDQLFDHLDALSEAKAVLASLRNGSVYPLTCSTDNVIADWQRVTAEERRWVDHHQAEILRLLPKAGRDN